MQKPITPITCYHDGACPLCRLERGYRLFAKHRLWLTGRKTKGMQGGTSFSFHDILMYAAECLVIWWLDTRLRNS